MNKQDKELLVRMRHIATHQGGLLTCTDGTTWHPSELLGLVELAERLHKQLAQATWPYPVVFFDEDLIVDAATFVDARDPVWYSNACEAGVPDMELLSKASQLGWRPE